MQKDILQSAGFSLVELMVVITIIITSGILVLPRLTQFRASSEIQEQASKILSVVKQAQTNAQSGAQCGDQFSPEGLTVSWKLIVTTNSYTIEPVCSTGSALPSASYTLNPGVTISKIALDNGNRSPDPVDVSSAPDGGSGSRVEFKNISGVITFYDGLNLEVLNYKRLIIVIASSNSKSGVFIEKGGLVYTGAVR